MPSFPRMPFGFFGPFATPFSSYPTPGDMCEWVGCIRGKHRTYGHRNIKYCHKHQEQHNHEQRLAQKKDAS